MSMALSAAAVEVDQTLGTQKDRHLATIPTPQGDAGWHALKALAQQRHILAALEVIHDELGDVFGLPLPGFNATMLVGPDANRFLLVEEKDSFRWRAESDPVTHLLRHGVLVEDGDSHDQLRREMNPSLHKAMLEGYAETMWRRTDQVIDQWRDGSRIDLLVEMRKIALLILTDTLFREDFTPQLKPLWNTILRTLKFISPGPWLVWPNVPRLGYKRALRQMDRYLYDLIAARRAENKDSSDLLGGLIHSGMNDDLIRDQLLTMLIAGHDTSTALLAWALHLLTVHPQVLSRARDEIDSVLGLREPTFSDAAQLTYLDQVIKETLRLYPPIHLGSRIAETDIQYQQYTIPAGSRVLYSIYLTHRHKHYWTNPGQFDPERFTPENARQRPPYTFLPFGGGARNCIGTAFAQVEAKIVLARILQKFDLQFTGKTVRPRMGATLEPQSGVMVQAHRRH
jgi:cytochrome P450